MLDRDGDVALTQQQAGRDGTALGDVDGDPDELAHSAALGASHRLPEPPSSQLSLPLDLGRDTQGVLHLGLDGSSRRSFDDADRASAQQIADRAGLAFTSSLLREEEHHIARRLQQALLPDELLFCPGVDLVARYEAGSDLLEVGGDWYDTFLLADGRLGLSVGDVVGHGLEAAAAMGRLRRGLAALARRTSQPGQLSTMLDEFASGPNGAAFTTACCVVLDPVTGAVSHASAGHPTLLVASRTRRRRWLWDGRCPAGPCPGGRTRAPDSNRVTSC